MLGGCRDAGGEAEWTNEADPSDAVQRGSRPAPPVGPGSRRRGSPTDGPASSVTPRSGLPIVREAGKVSSSPAVTTGRATSWARSRPGGLSGSRSRVAVSSRRSSTAPASEGRTSTGATTGRRRQARLQPQASDSLCKRRRREADVTAAATMSSTSGRWSSVTLASGVTTAQPSPVSASSVPSSSADSRNRRSSWTVAALPPRWPRPGSAPLSRAGRAGHRGSRPEQGWEHSS